MQKGYGIGRTGQGWGLNSTLLRYVICECSHRRNMIMSGASVRPSGKAIKPLRVTSSLATLSKLSIVTSAPPAGLDNNNLALRSFAQLCATKTAQVHTNYLILQKFWRSCICSLNRNANLQIQSWSKTHPRFHLPSTLSLTPRLGTIHTPKISVPFKTSLTKTTCMISYFYNRYEPISNLQNHLYTTSSPSEWNPTRECCMKLCKSEP